jgi:hypothetical protein
MPTLIDSPDDVLALFGGTIITIALIVFIFLIPEIREISAGALITILTLIYNHFFSKRNGNGTADGS